MCIFTFYFLEEAWNSFFLPKSGYQNDFLPFFYTTFQHFSGVSSSSHFFQNRKNDECVVPYHRKIKNANVI
jgi:hypothetical protein